MGKPEGEALPTLAHAQVSSRDWIKQQRHTDRKDVWEKQTDVSSLLSTFANVV